MSNNLTKTKENIKEIIYEIRGVQVMLDSDLGELYGVQAKRINEAKLFWSKISTKKLKDVEENIKILEFLQNKVLLCFQQ